MSSDKNKDNNDVIEPEDMTIDQIIINLKIIALIKKHEKLSIRNTNQSLFIDGKSNFLYIQSIKRWLNHDNRQRTIDYIEKIINKTFQCMDAIYEEFKNKSSDNKKVKCEEVFEEDKESLLLRLSKEIINSSEGLKNLRITYKQDSLINSQIQLILDKIRIKVDKINTALNVKWIIDKEYQNKAQYGE